MDKSIWFKRLLKISLIPVNTEGETIDDILRKLKKIRINENIPSIFSKFDQSGNKIWLSNSRLKDFILLAVDLGIFLNKNGKYYKSKEGDQLNKNRKNTFNELCKSSFLRLYRTDLKKINEAVQEISPPSTAKMIAKYLKLEMTKLEFSHFEAILQIYGDVSDDFVWTGLITFGIPYEIHLYNQITNDIVGKIINITAQSKNKVELRKKIKTITDQDIVLEQEIKNISEDAFNKKTPKSSMDDLLKIVLDYIEGKKEDDSTI